AAEPLLFRQKWPKPVTPRPASSDGTDAERGERANSQGSDKARRKIGASVPCAGRQASKSVEERDGHAHNAGLCLQASATPEVRRQWPCLRGVVEYFIR
ncbi:MAG: hypothetical protein ABI618_12890, partial [Nitrospirota bacterium]